MVGLMYSFKSVQLFYSIIGAMFMPMLALVLLLLNSQTRWVGDLKNRWFTTLALLFVLVAFLSAGYFNLEKKLKPLFTPPTQVSYISISEFRGKSRFSYNCYHYSESASNIRGQKL